MSERDSEKEEEMPKRAQEEYQKTDKSPQVSKDTILVRREKVIKGRGTLLFEAKSKAAMR